MSKYLLLLTACIKPNTACCLSLTDVKAREQQYREAVEWYFGHTTCDIVLAENSGSTLNLPQHITQNPRYEFVSINDSQDGMDRGKGYKEACILQYVSQHSRLYAQAEVIVKVTGRLIVRNTMDILASLPQDFGQRHFWGHFERRFHRLDTRFLIAGRQTFEQLLCFTPLIDDQHEPRLILEGAFALALTQKMLSGEATYVYPRLVTDYMGSGGGSGENYTLTPAQLAQCQQSHSRWYPLIRLVAPMLIKRNHTQWLHEVEARKAKLNIH